MNLPRGASAPWQAWGVPDTATPPVSPRATRSGRTEAAGALTDLALGAAAAAITRRLRRSPAAGPLWRATFALTAGASLLGAAHHGLLTRRHPGLAVITWRVIAATVAAALAALLLATVRQTLGPRATLAVFPLAAAGPAAYLASLRRGGGDLDGMVRLQAAAMSVVVLAWLQAAARGRPGGRIGVAAIATSAAAAGLRARPPAAAVRHGLGGDALYHVAQIPGLVLFARAAAAS